MSSYSCWLFTNLGISGLWPIYVTEKFGVGSARGRALAPHIQPRLHWRAACLRYGVRCWRIGSVSGPRYAHWCFSGLSSLRQSSASSCHSAFVEAWSKDEASEASAVPSWVSCPLHGMAGTLQPGGSWSSFLQCSLGFQPLPSAARPWPPGCGRCRAPILRPAHGRACQPSGPTRQHDATSRGDEQDLRLNGCIGR